MNVIEANGARIPAIGLGTMTWKEQVCIDAVKTALKLGYRHLDTAERLLGEAIRLSPSWYGVAHDNLKRVQEARGAASGGQRRPGTP